MPHCFLAYRPSMGGHGAEPDCPAGVKYTLLADLPGLEWGLFETSSLDGWTPETLVSEKLSGLIVSARRYPPALAIARNEVGQVFDEHRPTPGEFERVYGTALQVHLSKQHESPYVMGQALKDEDGLLIKGQWYWVLEITGKPPVAFWVSDDFYLCKAGINDFDFTGQQLKRLGYSA